MLSKKKISLSILIIGILILLGGCKNMEKAEQETYMLEQKPRIEKFLTYNYNNINSVTLTGTKKNPMGGFSIKGYINDDTSLAITVPVSSIDTDIEYVDGLNGEFIDNNYKFPGQDTKTISEIEKIENSTLSSSARMSLWKEKYN